MWHGFAVPPKNWFFILLCILYSILLYNPKENGGASRHHSLLGWSYKGYQKVNFVNFFDEDLTFEKWDNAKL